QLLHNYGRIEKIVETAEVLRWGIYTGPSPFSCNFCHPLLTPAVCIWRLQKVCFPLPSFAFLSYFVHQIPRDGNIWLCFALLVVSFSASLLFQTNTFKDSGRMILPIMKSHSMVQNRF